MGWKVEGEGEMEGGGGGLTVIGFVDQSQCWDLRVSAASEEEDDRNRRFLRCDAYSKVAKSNMNDPPKQFGIVSEIIRCGEEEGGKGRGVVLSIESRLLRGLTHLL